MSPQLIRTFCADHPLSATTPRALLEALSDRNRYVIQHITTEAVELCRTVPSVENPTALRPTHHQ